MATPDLSIFHNLIGKCFPKLPAQEAWDKYSLDEDKVRYFNDHGFVAGIQVLDDAQLIELRRELAMLQQADEKTLKLLYEQHDNESEQEGRELYHVLGAWRISRSFHDALWNPRFVVPACQLLGGKAVRFWHDQLFCKPAKHGGVVAWHQDYSYWTRTVPMQHLSCWIGLDDSTVSNGCLRYVPGSHKWSLLERPNIAGEMHGLEVGLSGDQVKALSDNYPAEMKAGFCSFHHPLTVHGSLENNSSRPRRGFVINVFADGTMSDANTALLNGVPVVKKGEPLGGQFFPLLFDPKTIALAGSASSS